MELICGIGAIVLVAVWAVVGSVAIAKLDK